VSDGYLTLLSDGERLTGAHALGPEAGATSGSSRVQRMPTLPAVRRRIPEPLTPRSEVLAAPMTGAGKEPVVFAELDTRQHADDTVALEWHRDTGETQIVVGDISDKSLLVFPVPGAKAREAFGHPFRYAQ
jgi:hypothetical protein